MTSTRLTYCGNVHPAETLDAWLAGVVEFAVPVAAAQPGPFGLGAWWNARCAATLAHDARARERVRAVLREHELAIWTLNIFPFGDFHGAKVKAAVYRPAWDEDARLRYTLDAAAAVAELVPAGEIVPMSTLPLGYQALKRPRAVENLLAASDALAALEQRTGVCCQLALEPEPFCLLESVADAIELFERELLPAARDEAVARRHLGVCVDLCHLLVVGEDPLQALEELARRGIAVPKIQVSSCLELREPGVALDRLLAFDEPRYLHQTVADNGARALDLDAVEAVRAQFEAAGRVRTHFHVPVFWDAEGPLGSTRDQVLQVLRGLPEGRPLLEVETYTWSVLDEAEFGAPDLVRGLCAELDFVRAAVGSL